MSDQPHTAGPWLVSGSLVYALEQDGWRNGEPIMVNRFSAHVQTTKLAHHDEAIANARLIAAAPELLEALKMLVEFADKMTGRAEPPYTAIACAYHAIAKATGADQ